MPGVQHGGNKIGRITTSGSITEFPVPTPVARADGITAGPDGAVYFTESPGNNAFGASGESSLRQAGHPAGTRSAQVPLTAISPTSSVRPVAPPGRIRRSSAIATMPSSITGSVAATVVSRTGSASSPSRIMSPAAPQLNCPVTVFTPTCSRWTTRTSKPIPSACQQAARCCHNGVAMSMQ